MNRVKLTKSRHVGSEDPPYIIAEIGSNHNGDMDLAKKLIDAAKRAGADCVKFQSWSKETIFSQIKYKENHFLSDDYRERNDYTLEEIVEEFAISESQLLEMRNYSKNVGIDFTSTPFSRKEADFLVEELKVDFIKIASMDLNNYSFLEFLANKGKPMVLSTGLSNLSEIDMAIRTIEQTGNKELVILHCVAIYPPKDTEVNLRNISTLNKLYPYPIGFSDHSLGTSIPLASVACGACLVEKHFTLDKNMFGWDHKVSANEEEMNVLSSESKRIFKAMGNFRVQQVENDERIESFRRSIVASREIKEGEVFKEDMLDFKRPGGGLSPDALKFVLGKTAKRSIEYDELVKISDF